MTHLKPSKLIVGGFFFLMWVLLPSQTHAQVPWTIQYVDMDITSGTGVATGTYEWPENILLHNNLFERVVKTLPTNNNYYALNNTDQCYPFSGGGSSFQNGLQTRTFTASTSQTTNNSGGAPDCDVSGYYHDIYRDTTASSTILYVLRWYYNAETNFYSNANVVTSTSTPTVPISKNIEILQPTYGQTFASTTFSVQVKYRTPFSLDFRPTTTRHFEIVDAVTGELNYSYNVTLEANSSENITINATTTLSEGSKYIRAMYLDQNGGIYSEVDEVFFNVATNTYYASTGLLTPNENPSALTQIDCGIFEFGCQFQKALTFLFIPSSNVLDKFKNLWQTIAEKRPFGYVTATITQLEELNTSGSSAFDLGTIPFMDSIFTPFRTLIGGILWAIFAIYFYKRRLIHLDI